MHFQSSVEHAQADANDLPVMYDHVFQNSKKQVTANEVQSDESSMKSTNGTGIKKAKTEVA
jgi:hypothetical protein